MCTQSLSNKYNVLHKPSLFFWKEKFNNSFVEVNMTKIKPTYFFTLNSELNSFVYLWIHEVYACAFRVELLTVAASSCWTRQRTVQGRSEWRWSTTRPKPKFGRAQGLVSTNSPLGRQAPVHLTFFGLKVHTFYISVFMFYLVHLSFRSCFET
jgi:hypothetical protein